MEAEPAPDRCPCGQRADTHCRHCARPLCLEHVAWQPFSLAPNGPIVQVRVCMPPCLAPWWNSHGAE